MARRRDWSRHAHQDVELLSQLSEQVRRSTLNALLRRGLLGDSPQADMGAYCQTRLSPAQSEGHAVGARIQATRRGRRP
jgi:hypothetical protein